MRGNNNFIWLSLAIIVVAATAAVGYALTLKTSVPAPMDLIAGKSQPAAQTDWKRVPEGGAKVDTVTGTVVAIDDGSSLTIDNSKISANPNDPQGPAVRTILIGDKTVIVAQVPLSDEEAAAAAKKYEKDLKDGKAGNLPSPYKEVAIAPADLRLTMNVTVTADDDVRNSEKLTAKKITFLALPSSLKSASATP